MEETAEAKIVTALFAAAFIIVGPTLLLAGLWRLWGYVYKRIRCTAEAEGQIVDFVRSRWKTSVKRGVKHTYYARWFPVYEYEAAGRRIRRRSRVPMLSLREPRRGAAPLRYDPRRPERYYVPRELGKKEWIITAVLLYVGGGFTAILVHMALAYLRAA